MQNKPLEGVKVLDVGVIAVGPFAATMLGYLGADVIRIEHPEGDYVQRQYPLMHGMGYAYITCNCNKKNIMLDLRQEQHKETAMKLVQTTDVFITNSKAGAMDRLGFSYEELSKKNPRLIYCSCPGYGHKGPLSKLGAADPYIQAFSGFGSLNGTIGSSGELFRVYGFVDQVASLVICQGVLMALLVREMTGVGQKIETSLLEASLALQATRIAEYFVTGRSPKPLGSSSSLICPSQSFRTLDQKYINVSVPDDKMWATFCRVMGLGQLQHDPRFATNGARLKNRNELTPILEKIFSDQPARWWIIVLQRHKIPCGPLNTYEEVSTDRHLLETEMVVELETPWGKVKIGGIPWEFSACHLSIGPPPTPDSNKAEILNEIEVPHD